MRVLGRDGSVVFADPKHAIHIDFVVGEQQLLVSRRVSSDPVQRLAPVQRLERQQPFGVLIDADDVEAALIDEVVCPDQFPIATNDRTRQPTQRSSHLMFGDLRQRRHHAHTPVPVGLVDHRVPVGLLDRAHRMCVDRKPLDGFARLTLRRKRARLPFGKHVDAHQNISRIVRQHVDDQAATPVHPLRTFVRSNAGFPVSSRIRVNHDRTRDAEPLNVELTGVFCQTAD